MGLYIQGSSSSPNGSHQRAAAAVPGLRKQTMYSASAFLLLTAVVSYSQITGATPASNSYQTTKSNASISSSISAGVEAAHQVADQASATESRSQNSADTNDNPQAANQALDSDSATMRVVVNGVDINVPTNGTTTQTINNESGTGQSNVTVSTTTGQSTDDGVRSYSSSYTRTRVNSRATNSSISFNMEQSSP